MILNEFFDSNKKHSPQQGVAEGSGQLLSVQQLAAISDAALDQAYGYGRSTPGNTFGWQANLMSAAYAKKLIDAGVTDIEKISDAIHKGWNVTAQKFVQNPEQFDDTEKLRQAGKLEAKLQQRAKLMKINYAQLDNEEQEKDRVVARALLQAIKSQQGVAEARSPEEFVRQMDKIAATPQTFEVGDWVTIDPNETSGYASSGMIGRIIELYDDEGESMAKIAVGGGSGVQKKLGKGVRSSGTHTVVPTSILQKDDPRGVAEAINPDITNPEFSHQQQIGDYLYVARYWGRRKNPIGLKISAYHGNKLIGRADLMYHSAPFDDFADPETTPNRIWLESEITEVNPKYQRQGIMSTMYAYARMLGNTVKPSHSRSDDAKAAWASWKQAGDKEHLTKMRAEGVAEGSFGQNVMQYPRGSVVADKHGNRYTVLGHQGRTLVVKGVVDGKRVMLFPHQLQQGVAEGKMAELEMDLEDPEITDRQFEKMYGMTRKEAREQFSQTDMWAFPEIRDPNRPLHERGVAEGLPQTLRKVVPGYAKREIDKKMDAGKFGKTDADKDANFQRYKKIQDKIKEQGVAEAFGPLPRKRQQIRLGRHTVDIERVGLDKNYISFAWHDSQGQEHYEEVQVGDLGSYDDLIDRIKDEIRYQERQYTDQGVAEGSEWETRHDEFVTVGDRATPEQINKIVSALGVAAKQASSKRGFLNQIVGKQSNGDLARMAHGAETLAKNIQRNRNAKLGTDERKELGQQLVYAVSLLKRMNGEQGVAEVSDATKQNYKARAQAQVRELKPYTKKGEYRDIAQRAIDRRTKGLARVKDKTNITSVTESGMKEKSIEFRDYQTMTPGAFHSRYSMTRDEWMARNRNLFSKINPAHQARDTALAKMRQAAAARADVKAAQALAPRVSEAVTTPEGRPALGQANIETLIQTYKQNRPFAELSFGKSGNLNINRQQMRLIMDHYLKLGSPEEKHDFVYETMSRMLKVVAMFNSYGIDVRTQISMPPGQTSQIPGAQPQLFELDASEVKDTRLSRALKQARAEFPTAGSDIEAFLKLVMSNDDRDLATMNRIQTVNTKQSELIDRIQNIDNQQTKEIDDLESQLDRVTSVNQELERQLDAIQAKPKRDDKKDSKPEQSKQPETKPLRRPATPELPVAQAAKASKPKTKKTQQAKPLELPAPAVKAAPLQIGYDPAQASLFGLDKEVSDVIPIYRGQDSANDSAQSPISMYDKEIGSLTQADLDQDAANDTAQPRRQANAESRKPQRAIADTDFDSPEWHEKVRGIGQRAKQGPLKTVWDEKRKVYRNVPVDRPPANNKPNMTEARLQRRAVLLKILES